MFYVESVVARLYLAFTSLTILMGLSTRHLVGLEKMSSGPCSALVFTCQLRSRDRSIRLILLGDTVVMMTSFLHRIASTQTAERSTILFRETI